jgi:uncharacterized protein YcbX
VLNSFVQISEESLENLNSRMPSPLPMDRFRPNIVVKGGSPFDEDEWQNMRVLGTDVSLRGVKCCSRCKLTTTNQETGEQGDTESEPLKTLRTFRTKPGRAPDEVYFGQNVVQERLPPTGKDVLPQYIRVGDTIEVLKKGKVGMACSYFNH